MTINSFLYGMRRFSDAYNLIYDRVVQDERRGRLGEDADYYAFFPSLDDPYKNPRMIMSSTKRNECIHLVVAGYVCCVRGILEDIGGMSPELVSLGEEIEGRLEYYGRALMELPLGRFTDADPELSDMLLSYYMAILAFHDMFRTHLFELNEKFKKDEFISKSIVRAFGAMAQDSVGEE